PRWRDVARSALPRDGEGSRPFVQVARSRASAEGGSTGARAVRVVARPAPTTERGDRIDPARNASPSADDDATLTDNGDAALADREQAVVLCRVDPDGRAVGDHDVFVQDRVAHH